MHVLKLFIPVLTYLFPRSLSILNLFHAYSRITCDGLLFGSPEWMVRLLIRINFLYVLVTFQLGNAADGIWVSIAVDEDYFLHLIVLGCRRMYIEVRIKWFLMNTRMRFVLLTIFATGAANGIIILGRLFCVIGILYSYLQVLNQHLFLRTHLVLHVHIKYFVQGNDQFWFLVWNNIKLLVCFAQPSAFCIINVFDNWFIERRIKSKSGNVVFDLWFNGRPYGVSEILLYLLPCAIVLRFFIMDVILVFFLSIFRGVIFKLFIPVFSVVKAHSITGFISKNSLHNFCSRLPLRSLNNCGLPDLDSLLILP